MFAGYTERARRAVFFARQEAIQSGAPQIEAEDLLIGLMRENRDLLPQILESDVDSLRTEIKGRIPRLEPVPQVMTMPLSDKAKKVLSNARERLRFYVEPPVQDFTFLSSITGVVRRMLHK